MALGGFLECFYKKQLAPLRLYSLHMILLCVAISRYYGDAPLIYIRLIFNLSLRRRICESKCTP